MTDVTETCACGKTVTPTRSHLAWNYYCQNCGRDWERAAPPKAPERGTPQPPKRKPARKRDFSDYQQEQQQERVVNVI